MHAPASALRLPPQTLKAHSIHLALHAYVSGMMDQMTGFIGVEEGLHELSHLSQAKLFQFSKIFYEYEFA